MKQIKIPDTNSIVELFVFDCAGQSIFNQVEMNSKYVSPKYCFIITLTEMLVGKYFCCNGGI